MKKIGMFFIFFTCLWASSTIAFCNEPYQIHIVRAEVFKKGNSLKIAFALDFQHLRIPSNDQLIIQPVIISTNDTLRLPYLLFPGKIRAKVNSRKMDLYGEEKISSGAFATLYPKKNDDDLYIYEDEIPFEHWMYGARVELQQDVYGCADCHKVLADISLNSIPDQPRVAFIVPRLDTNREERVILHVNFPWDQAVLNLDYMNNAIELAKIDQVLQHVNQGRPAILRGISLTGYASPEGAYPYNERLAGRRLAVMKNYIITKYPMDESLMYTDLVPEDWNGVYQWVDSSDLRYRAEVLDIINHTSLPDLRDNKIYKIDGGKTYRRLLRELYPILRRVEFKINYDVSFLPLDKCRELWGTYPERLSAGELYFLAQSYPVDSPEFERIILTTVQLYPEDPVANNNAAAIALKHENVTDARVFLARAGNSPQMLNNQGVLFLLEGNLPDAYRCFSEAQQSGCQEGETNRVNLDRVRQK